MVRLPYPDAQTAPVHEKDMAALAVTALTEPGHSRQAYAIGAEAILRAWADGDGISARISTIVERITGRPAHTFAQWAADHADDFR